MKTLAQVTPTPEQLAIISLPRAGVQLIRGAAGIKQFCNISALQFRGDCIDRSLAKPYS